ncbi:MAG: hypothetical protein ISS44_05035 [Candidatus Omnitrophica bacterium]|nr:hypothetical protein [Candidatus Omnitrophota bacterium]
MWQGAILGPGKIALYQIGNFFLNLGLIILILIAGWFIARIVRTIIVRVLKTVRLDVLSEHTKIDELLQKGGVEYTLSELLGVIFYWLLLLVALVVAVNAVGLSIAADLLNRIILYIPNVIAAIFILVLGAFLARALGNVVQAASANADIAQSKFLGKIAEVVIFVFALAMTLEQLNIGKTVVGLAVNIILASLGLGFALAIGLGCKDIVGKAVTDWIEKLKSKK